MKFARDLFERVRHLFHEMAKFGLVGLVGFAITEVGFNLCHFDLKLGLFTSNAIASVVATAATFVGNKFWTFRHRSGQGATRETIAFFVLNGIGMLVQYAAVWICEDSFGVTDKLLINLAFLAGICVATVFRFWSYRKFVWHAPVAEPSVGASPRGALVHPR